MCVYVCVYVCVYIMSESTLAFVHLSKAFDSI